MVGAADVYIDRPASLQSSPETPRRTLNNCRNDMQELKRGSVAGVGCIARSGRRSWNMIGSADKRGRQWKETGSIQTVIQYFGMPASTSMTHNACLLCNCSQQPIPLLKDIFSSQLAKRRQCKHESEAELEGHVVVDCTSEVDAFHVPLQSIDWYERVTFPCSILVCVSLVRRWSGCCLTVHTTIPTPSSSVKLLENALSIKPAPNPNILPNDICLTAAGFSDLPSFVRGVFASREWV